MTASKPSASLAEMINLVAGFALVFWLWPNGSGEAWLASLGNSRGVAIARGIIAGIGLTPVLLAPIVACQFLRRREIPRPGEWLLLTMAAYRIKVGLVTLGCLPPAMKMVALFLMALLLLWGPIDGISQEMTPWLCSAYAA